MLVILFDYKKCSFTPLIRNESVVYKLMKINVKGGCSLETLYHIFIYCLAKGKSGKRCVNDNRHTGGNTNGKVLLNSVAVVSCAPLSLPTIFRFLLKQFKQKTNMINKKFVVFYKPVLDIPFKKVASVCEFIRCSLIRFISSLSQPAIGRSQHRNSELDAISKKRNGDCRKHSCATMSCTARAKQIKTQIDLAP